MARSDLGGELFIPKRKPVIRASGVRYWGTAKQWWMWNRTFPEMTAGAVTKALRERSPAGKKAAAAIKGAVVSASSDSPVQQPSPRLTTRRTPAPGIYTGRQAPTVVKGKGRSTSLGDIYRPSKELRIDEPPERRLGSLFSGAGGRRQSGATMMSNFGANKENGQGFLGMSAGRVRGARNIMAHPETFMSRFLWVYAAKHVTQQVTDWRGWNKVSWTMTDQQAQRTLGEHQKTNPSVDVAAAGFVGGSLARVSTALSDFWLMGLAAFPTTIGALLGDSGDGRLSEAQAARASSFLNQGLPQFLASGGKGRIFGIDGNITSEAEIEASTQRNRAMKTGRQRYDDMMTKNLVRMKDIYALRGVGGVEDVRHALNQRDDFKAALAEHQGAELMKIDYEKIVDMVMNRIISGKRDKKK